MSTESTEAEQKTIRFNVGGQFYEVSKSLIEQHEETMLARFVSDAWLADPNSTIFIDRDGERFKYVLDYLRYGKVSLPLTVPREMFLLDMEYYGFNSVDKDTARSILVPSQVDDSLANKEALLRWANAIHSSHLALNAMTQSKEELELDILVLFKAKEYAQKYMNHKSENPDTPLVVTMMYNNYSKDPFFIYLQKHHVENFQLFNTFLGRFGLKGTVKPSGNSHLSLIIDTL